MAQILNTCIVFILFGVFKTLHGVNMQGTNISKEEVRRGILDSMFILDGIGKLPSTEKIVNSISKLSGILGIAGGFLSFVLAFIPEKESPVLKLLTQEFARLNMKLDEVSTDLDDIKNLITLETQRAVYIDEASKILYGYERMELFFRKLADVNCSTTAECLERKIHITESYLTDFNIKIQLYQILTGTCNKTSVFGDPLLDLIKTTYKCDLPKILTFANGVIKLAFKAQQVILIHEKLTGTTFSVISSLKYWNSLVYGVRQKANELTASCYTNIKTYIKEDVERTTYQTNMRDNKRAASEMKKELNRKYPWIIWMVISYGAYGSQNHWGQYAFINMPSVGRQRVLRVQALDNGTFSNQREKFAYSISVYSSSELFPYSGDGVHAQRIYNGFDSKFRSSTVQEWKLLQSFLVLTSFSDLHIDIDSGHESSYFNELVTIVYRKKHYRSNRYDLKYMKVRIIASFKSNEQIYSNFSCHNCNHKGSCRIKPYTTASSCYCQAFYDGQYCNEHNEINPDSEMFKVTARIPKLTDIYFAMIHMTESFTRSLKEQFDELYDKLSKKLG